MLFLELHNHSVMSRIFISALIVYFIISIRLVAQSDVRIRKEDFQKEKEGFNQAWNNIVSGDAFYARKGTYYNNAYDHYTQALVYNSNNPELNYKTGISAIYSDHKEEAAGFLLRALESKSDVADDILLYTGRALQYSARYEDAIDKLTGYLKSKVTKTEKNVILAKRFIEECNSAIIITKDTLGIEITNIGANINSESDDFSPVLTFDGSAIYFASRRNYTNSSNSLVDSKPDENIYFSKISDGKWSIASLAGFDLISDYNEAPLSIDSAGTRLYIFSGFENGGDIKVSVLKNGRWKTPESLPFSINSIGSEIAVAFHPSGNEVYFVTSSGRDNLGEHDIYYIKKTNPRKWSKPQNCGPGINTSYDEQSVTLSSSGDTLWFSSKGHNSIGGFDIFYSVRNHDGTWGKAKNAGYPLNSSWDDMFRNTASSSDSIFYFASNRNGGFGGLDIYMGRKVSGSTFSVPLIEAKAEWYRSDSP
jgi:hypothetical protein